MGAQGAAADSLNAANKMDLQGYKPSLPEDPDYLKKLGEQIPKTKEFAHIEFEHLTELLKAIGIEDDPYLIWQQTNDAIKVDSIAAAAFEKFQNPSTAIKELLFSLWDHLAEQDQLEKSDLIFVFGGETPQNRATQAIELYKQNFAPKILFSGHSARYMKEIGKSEAQVMAEIAIDHGVPKEAIILEERSKNTPENVLFSIEIFKEKNWLPEKIILVTSPWHMLRCQLSFKAQADWKPKMIRSIALLAGAGRDEYYESLFFWKYYFNEYIKLYGARLMQHF